MYIVYVPPRGSYARLAMSIISESMAIETRGPRIHGGDFHDFWGMMSAYDVIPHRFEIFEVDYY